MREREREQPNSHHSLSIVDLGGSTILFYSSSSSSNSPLLYSGVSYIVHLDRAIKGRPFGGRRKNEQETKKRDGLSEWR